MPYSEQTQENLMKALFLALKLMHCEHGDSITCIHFKLLETIMAYTKEATIETLRFEATKIQLTK